MLESYDTRLMETWISASIMIGTDLALSAGLVVWRLAL